MFAAVVALLVQLVFLPYVIPQWHAGNGLMIGGDWLGHHKLAVELMEEIRPESFSDELFSYSTTTAIQRLGYLFEYELNNQLLADQLYQRSREFGSSFQRIPLRQSIPHKDSSSDNRWRVAVNVEIEMDDI